MWVSFDQNAIFSVLFYMNTLIRSPKDQNWDWDGYKDQKTGLCPIIGTQNNFDGDQDQSWDYLWSSSQWLQFIFIGQEVIYLLIITSQFLINQPKENMIFSIMYLLKRPKIENTDWYLHFCLYHIAVLLYLTIRASLAFRYEALHLLEHTLSSRRWKKSSSNIFHCDYLNLGVKMTARMRAFRIYPILPHLKPFS